MWYHPPNWNKPCHLEGGGGLVSTKGLLFLRVQKPPETSDWHRLLDTVLIDAKAANPEVGSWHSHRIHGAGIYANIGGILMVNVTIYSIHGSYGIASVAMNTASSFSRFPSWCNQYIG